LSNPAPPGLRVVFAGTPEFARTALERLVQADYQVVLVLTQPDRPAGRGMKLQPSPVKQFALEQGIPVAQPQGLKLEGKYPQDAAAALEALQAARADVMVVAAYGLILPEWVLQTFRLGCLNIHASLLPRWRGAAPIHRAIEAGDTQTGVTIMQMDAGLDTGDMLLTHTVDVTPQDTTASLHERLAYLGADMVVQALELSASGGLKSQAQPQDGITYAHKIEKAEAQIDWNLPAQALDRKIRAFNPFPGAAASFGGEVVKIWGAKLDAEPNESLPTAELKTAEPGTILSSGPEGVCVQCGHGRLWLTELQRAGGKRLAAADFVRGFDLPVGERWAVVR